MTHDRIMNIFNRLVIEIDEALIKAKAEIEYVDDDSRLMEIGFLEDTISGDLMRDR
jgi:archaeosine-15-forming tRNA-guanine transglycosylase